MAIYADHIKPVVEGIPDDQAALYEVQVSHKCQQCGYLDEAIPVGDVTIYEGDLLLIETDPQP